MNNMELTREDVIDLYHHAAAVTRKAQCRQVNCDLIDKLADITKDLMTLDYDFTEVIGD